MVEEVAAVGLVAQGGAFGELLSAVGHVLRAAGGDFAQEYAVERELVEHGHGAADQVAVGGDGDEVDGVAVVGVLEHVEGFAEAEVAEDVHG